MDELSVIDLPLFKSMKGWTNKCPLALIFRPMDDECSPRQRRISRKENNGQYWTNEEERVEVDVSESKENVPSMRADVPRPPDGPALDLRNPARLCFPCIFPLIDCPAVA